MRLIIDGDPLVYRAGFGAEKRWYSGVIEGPNGELQDFRKAAGQEWKAFNESLSLLPGGCWRMIYREHEVVAEPVQNAIHLLHQQIGTMHADIEAAGHKIEQVNVLLTGPGNFRDRLATIRPYKGNRDPEHKPVHYQALRDYLTRSYGARVVHGREADDETSILAWAARRAGKPYIISTIDKDLDQVPGLHYDYLKHVIYDVSEEEARVALWTQILAGDGGDNVPGAQGWGPVKARRLIQKLVDEGYSDLRLWDEVVKRYGGRAEPALETARLVYMLREPGEVWYPVGARVETKTENYDD